MTDTGVRADGQADPVAIDLNVDAALLLKDMVGIDAYPVVLALMPNIYRSEDRDRVHAVVVEELDEAGILVDGGVHPTVAHWLQCLYRPDVELAVRVLDYEADGQSPGMLRLSLVRSGDTHVLAVRCDDHIVIQSVFQEGEQLDTVSAAVLAALGPCPPVEFEPVTVSAAQLEDIPAEPAERRQALLELGAHPHTAGVLVRVLDEVVRRAEVVVIEHHDGTMAQPEVCVTVLDTPAGRIAVSPNVAMDGELWSTYAPGDDAGLRTAVAALVELLPGRRWFGTSRIG